MMGDKTKMKAMIADAADAGDEEMNTALVNTLRTLKTDPSVVVRLYEQLYSATYFALTNSGTGSSLATMAFLTYDTADGVRELPLFTEERFILHDLEQESLSTRIDGPALWSRLVELIETRMCEVGVDPGQGHGIRMNREMVLGMIAMYGAKDAEDHG